MKETKILSSFKDGKLVINAPYKNKPIILIFPGGGYHHLADREAYPVSEKFIGIGYNTAILFYSVYPYCYPTQINEANEAVNYLKEKYNKVYVLGFSAGGHLAGLVATENKNVSAMFLSYPVISFLDYAHQGSIKHLLQDNDTLENKSKLSLQNRVDNNTPPCFIWHTKTDTSVPYENTLMMVEALKKNNIVHECVLFNSGQHGLALADKTAIKDGDTSYINDEVSVWPELLLKFIKMIEK